MKRHKKSGGDEKPLPHGVTEPRPRAGCGWPQPAMRTSAPWGPVARHNGHEKAAPDRGGSSDSAIRGYNPNARRISSTASSFSQPKNSISRSVSRPSSHTVTFFV